MSEDESIRFHREVGQDPPMSWYAGIGRTDSGIMTVTFSEEFEQLADGEVGRAIGEWRHYTGNTFVDGRLIKDSSEAKDPKVRAILEHSENIIKQATGFTPKQLADRRLELSQTYRGKKDAPFKVELG